MKVTCGRLGIMGLTLIEVLVVVVILFVLAAMVIPGVPDHHRSTLVMCLSQQKQVSLGIIMFQSDHSGNYPWQVSATNDGSLEASTGPITAPHFRALSPYFGGQTRFLVCPTDTSRSPAADLSKLVETDLSYFLNLNACSTNNSALTGDRHLMSRGRPVHPGSFAYSTNMDMSWTRELHGNVKNGPIGVLSFGDGHAEAVKSGSLNTRFQNQPVATNLLVVP